MEKKQPTNLALINDEDPEHKQAQSRYQRELALVNNYNHEQFQNRRRHVRENSKLEREK